MLTPDEFITHLQNFNRYGPTVVTEVDRVPYLTNAFWTAQQRQGHSLHDISYRACFKAQLPEFFIERLTKPIDVVYDPFSGRGTTAVQAMLMNRLSLANDSNPLSAMMLEPRLRPPNPVAIEKFVQQLDLNQNDNPEGGRLDYADPQTIDLLTFYHPETLNQIKWLRLFLDKFKQYEPAQLMFGELSSMPIVLWIKMVALTRLTGHSSGYFSVRTLPPNQAVSAKAQSRINQKLNQTPQPRDVKALIWKKSQQLLSDPIPEHPLPGQLFTGKAEHTPDIVDSCVDLIVTSPPFLDVVDYKADNWLRCWFAGIDMDQVHIDSHRTVGEWEAFIRRSILEFARVVRPGGFIAFEVGEVRHGKILLERHVIKAIEGLPFTLLGVMVNDQDFTKTASCWGVANNRGGTNTNRIVLLVRQ